MRFSQKWPRVRMMRRLLRPINFLLKFDYSFVFVFALEKVADAKIRNVKRMMLNKTISKVNIVHRYLDAYKMLILSIYFFLPNSFVLFKMKVDEINSSYKEILSKIRTFATKI